MSSKYDELEKLANLKDKGIITEKEFEDKKKEILGEQEKQKENISSDLPKIDSPTDMKKLVLYILLGIIIMGVASAILSAIISNNSTPSKSGPNQPSDIEQIATVDPSKIEPYGELADIFNLMSKHTNIQRENMEKEIKGQIVVWQLPVYEVSKHGEYYRVQTSAGSSLSGMARVGTFVYIKPRNEQEKMYIESIKTGDNITFKGKIDGVSMRNINIKPAILFGESSKVSAPAAPGAAPSAPGAAPGMAPPAPGAAPPPGSAPVQGRWFSETELLELGKYINKHPDARFSKIIERAVTSCTKLNPRFSRFSDNLQVTGLIERKVNSIVLEGQAPHLGGSEEAILAIDQTTGSFSGAILTDGKADWCSSSGKSNISQNVKTWFFERTKEEIR